MLFTVSLQLTMTSHLSTSPSSISLACMLSGLCLLLSSLLFMTAFFTLSPLCCPPSSPASQITLLFLSCPFLAVSPKPSLNFVCFTPSLAHCLSTAVFLCSLLPNFLPLCSISFSYSRPFSTSPPSSVPPLLPRPHSL